LRVLHLDIPTPDQFRRLGEVRADFCVSIYLRTTPLSQQADAMRIEFANLAREAASQVAAAGPARGRLAMLEEHLQDLVDDAGFWTLQASSLAVLATPDAIRTFRLANALRPQVQVSDRFHLKPLLRAITFPHVALVLALSENGVRLIEVLPEGPPIEIRVPDMPRDAASSVGKASINDRSHSQRIHGSEGKKVRLAQYARQVDAALRPVLAQLHAPLFLAASDPMASIFRAVSTAAELQPGAIAGSPDRTADAALAAEARRGLDALYARDIADFHALFDRRRGEGRATTDLSDAARAAAFGAVDRMLVDIDATLPGTYDPATGAFTLAGHEGADSYGVVDAVAAQALATGARVLGVRQADIPGQAGLAAVLRYPV
jgi:hypothetical protein